MQDSSVPASSSPSAAGATIVAENFGWHYPAHAHPVISTINLRIEPGEKVLLLGPSGAGKTTLLHAMGGLLHDDDGESQLGSLTINGVPTEQALGASGLMQQDPESSVVLARVGDDVAFGPENLQVPLEEIWQRVDESLRAVGLENIALDRSTSALSGGQKQRLGLAGILAMHAGAILLDEPTANLDPDGVSEVRDAVLQSQKITGATLVVIEHRVEIWAEHVDRVIVVNRAGITHDGSPAEVLEDAREQLIAAGVWVPNYLPEIPASVSSAGEVLISAENIVVTRRYPSRKMIKQRRRELLAGKTPELDLEPVAQKLTEQVRAGEHLGILGPNGAGKSTFALTLAGLLIPVTGELRASSALSRGVDVKDTTLESDIASWKPADLASRIGLVFQEPEQQFIRHSVREELEFGPRHIARAHRQTLDEDALNRRTQELLERLRLEHVENANPFTLSGGEKRRLSVATALATAPRVLILDEPTFGQDANTWTELVLLIRELLEQSVAVISVTHDLDFVRAVGGRTLTFDSTHQILSNASSRRSL